MNYAESVGKEIAIARVCHETNRAFCQTIDDWSHKPWDDAPQWQKDSAVAGVKFHLENPGSPPSASHESWLKVKKEAGWVYGEVKDEIAKTHPCIVPYKELPPDQQKKDALFIAVVEALK